MIEPLFLKPYFQEKMWGGTRLKSEFGYQIPSDHTGECWAISAHPHGRAIVENGEFSGVPLDQLWQEHRELFGNAKGKVFPLLTKILDAHRDLSVQVHPDDNYAAEHEHELGKTECWYIIAAEPDAKLIYGHTAQTRAELAEMIKQQKWQQLLRYVPVKAGDFFYVPSGTIHALGAGIMALETQQSSDTTYRVYDFDRVDPTTHQKRQLHLQQSIDVTNVPHVDPRLQSKKYRVGDAQVIQYVETDFFAVYRWDLAGGGTANFVRKDAPYTLMSVLSGSGQLQINGQDYSLKKGQHLILPFQVKSWKISGQLEIIASEPGEKS
jgi:mannose-6-phosphate isomerase